MKLNKLTLIALSLLCLSGTANREVIHPTAPVDFRNVSCVVRSERAGGSGTVIRSSPQGSEILTNEHVCIHAKESGSLIDIKGKLYVVDGIKPWGGQDLCMMHIKEDLHIGVEVTEDKPVFGDEITVAGHPLLLPLIVQKGTLSETINMGGRLSPEYDTVTSVLVQHGSSGSGVYNKEGELIGVISAMSTTNDKTEMGFGIMVPYRDTRRFVNVDSKLMQWLKVPHARP